MKNILQDFRFTLRQLRKSPGFALTTVLTLALGIAANVIVFSVLNALVLRPLAVPDAQQVYFVQHPEAGHVTFSYPQYRDLRDRNHSFSALAMFRIVHVGLRTRDDAGAVADPVWGYEASGNYFDMLGVQPLLGRFFRPADDRQAGSSPVAVLSYACWQERFGADPEIVGRVVHLNKHPFTVIGVAAKGFQGTERFYTPEIWVPVTDEAQLEGFDFLEARGAGNSWLVGRLGPGTTARQAQADLNIVAAHLDKEYPKTDEHMAIRLTRPGFIGDALGAPVRGFLFGLMVMASLALLAACANLGSLFAARASDRSRELAIRIAVGSSRWRVFRQLLTESVVVSILGGAVGLAAASTLLHLLSLWHPPIELPVQFFVDPDAGVYIFAGVISVAAGILFGLVPARQIWKTAPNQAMKSSAGTVLSTRRFALRDLLLAGQIALCCVLVTASFVALRGLGRALHAPMGFDPAHATVAGFDLEMANYKGTSGLPFQQHVLEEVSHLPGVTAAGFTNTTPLALDQSETSVYSEDTADFRPSTVKLDANYYSISPGYLRAAGTRLIAGRDFTWNDNTGSPRVAIANQTFARKLFGTDAAVGKYFLGYGGHDKYEIVGVVEDGKYTTLAEDPTPALFYPTGQEPNTSTVLIVRSDLDTSQMAAAIRQTIARLDSSVAIYKLSSWQDDLATVLFPARAASIALGVFGILAMMLAMTGIYGLAAYTVSRRMRELGIRVALGARSMQVAHAALGRTALLLACGSAIGLLLGVAASRLLASIVYQASANDPPLLLAVAFTMVLVGMVSAALPAKRALSAQPAMLLRDE